MALSLLDPHFFFFLNNCLHQNVLISPTDLGQAGISKMALSMLDKENFAFIKMFQSQPWIWESVREDYHNSSQFLINISHSMPKFGHRKIYVTPGPLSCECCFVFELAEPPWHGWWSKAAHLEGKLVQVTWWLQHPFNHNDHINTHLTTKVTLAHPFNHKSQINTKWTMKVKSTPI